MRVDPEVHRSLERSFELGFLGSMPIDEQIEHALGFTVIVEEKLGRMPTSVIDLGTGGGVPGLVLVSCWPEATIVLMDASERRTAFLQASLDSWPKASRTEVVRGRAEELGHEGGLREQFEVVTSRSFGIPGLTAECGSAFLTPGGWMVISEPPDTDQEGRWPGEGLSIVGMEPDQTVRLSDRFGYQVLKKVDGIEGRFPRRVGIPAKRPIF